jgi:hypothetical protein
MTGPNSLLARPSEAVKYQLSVSTQISKLSAGNWRKYFTVVAAQPLLIKTLPHFQIGTENPRVGGSIPLLATIRISTLSKDARMRMASV